MNNNVNNWIPSSIEIIQGFFVADGSFQVRMYKNQDNLFSYYVAIVFSQSERNESVLYGILSFLNDKTKTVTKRIHVGSTSDNVHNTRSITLSIGSHGGSKMFSFWETNPPIAVSKLNDFRIVSILSKVDSKKANHLIIVNDCLEQKDHITDLRIANLALLQLRYEMYAARNDVGDQRLIQEHYNSVRATKEEIEIAQEVCNNIMISIKKEQEAIKTNPSLLIERLSDYYLLGYYIGDGSFMLQVNFENNKAGVLNANVKVRIQFTLSDCLESTPVFQAIKEKLQCGQLQTYSTYLKYVISYADKVNIVVNLWKTKNLPQPRQNQYDLICEALSIVGKKEHLIKYESLQRLIEIKWSMNAYTNFKKKGSLEDDMQKADDYFKNR